MKKNWKLFLFFFLILIIFLGGISCLPFKTVTNSSPKKEIQKEIKKEFATILKIVFPAKEREYKVFLKKDETVFDQLKKASSIYNFPLDYSTSSFGVFVKKIGDLENSQNSFWLYKVNGETAKVAADKYFLKENDLVEWEYQGL